MAVSKLLLKGGKLAFKHGIRLSKNPKNVAGFFKKAVRSQLAEHLRRTTIKTSQGKVRLLNKGKTLIGRQKPMQQALFDHSQIRKAAGKDTPFKGLGVKRYRIAGNVTERIKPLATSKGGFPTLERPTQITLRPYKRVTDYAKRRGGSLKIQNQWSKDAGRNPKFTGGHHRFERDLGEALTDGMDDAEKLAFWPKARKSSPSIFPGDDAANLMDLPEGRQFKMSAPKNRPSAGNIHQAGIHKILKKVKELNPEWIKKQVKGLNADERLELLKVIERKLKRVDEWMFKRKQMWNQLDQPFLERLRLRKLYPDKKEFELYQIQRAARLARKRATN